MKKLLLLLLLLFGYALPAQAAPYIVRGVTVDITANSTVDARNKAIAEAQRKAFMNLAAQLLPNQPIPQISDTQIGNMISDFRVEKEQYGAKRYVGSFTFRFRENPVRAVFGSQYIPSPQELPARMPAQTVTTVTTTTTTAEAAETIMASPDDATAIINSEATQIPPLTVMDGLSPDIDMNSPVKMMLIETGDDSAALQMAQQQLRIAPGVVDIAYTSPKVLRMAYRGDTLQLVNDLRAKGVSLQQKAPTQPPIYILAP